MGRRLLALSFAAVLPLGALCAPLVHAHADNDHGSHHGASRVHAHLGGHGLAGPDQDHHDVPTRGLTDHDAPADTSALEPETDPEQVTALQLFVAAHVNGLTTDGLESLEFTLPMPPESMMRRPPAVSHGHDPPVVSVSRPRAPPAHLS